MKKINIIIIILISFLSFQCSDIKKDDFSSNKKSNSFILPKVLILTSGNGNGNGEIAQGITIAIQSFNKNGAIVKLDNRDILYDTDRLNKYNILILSSAIGYHDADRKYSLSFMSDEEIKNIENFVAKGGILIAGDNIGRNKISGDDRISLYGKLDIKNWGLSKCFGVSMIEKNMKNYKISGNINDDLKGIFKEKNNNDLWTLVIDTAYSDKIIELASWTNGEKKYPAIIQNDCKKGIGFLLASSYFLHPVNDGGYWSSKQIQNFYDYVLEQFNKKNNCDISLNTWPNGNDYAFCVSLNASGDKSEYKRIFNLLEKNNIEPSLFVNGFIDSKIKKFLLSKKCNLQSNGYAKINYRNKKFPVCKNDILKNEDSWKMKFTGFRFPYTLNEFSGLLALDDLNYKFESSIGADNINFFNGCVFPYNLPISDNLYYKITDILEISPTYRDDYFFYKNKFISPNYSSEQLLKDAQLYEKYLINYWKYAVKPNNGLMVFLGHPEYVANSDTTIKPLKNLIKKVKEDNTWITSMDEVADYWNNINSLEIKIENSKNKTQIYFSAPENTKIENLCLNLKRKPEKISLNTGKYKLIKKEDKFQLIFDASDKQIIKLYY